MDQEKLQQGLKTSTTLGHYTGQALVFAVFLVIGNIITAATVLIIGSVWTRVWQALGL